MMASKMNLKVVLLMFLAASDCGAFSVLPLTCSSPGTLSQQQPVPFKSLLLASISPDAEDDDIEREYARVRRGRRSSYYDDDEDDGYGYDRNRGVYSNDDIADMYDDTEETYYMDDEEDDDDDDDYEVDMDDEEYGFFGNAVIPNPLLDSIDPDGAADRFPELASDPRFWFDMIIFLVALDFLSAIGPREALGNAVSWW